MLQYARHSVLNITECFQKFFFSKSKHSKHSSGSNHSLTYRGEVRIYHLIIMGLIHEVGGNFVDIFFHDYSMLVPAAGLEPALHRKEILSLLRLPIPPSGLESWSARRDSNPRLALIWRLTGYKPDALPLSYGPMFILYYIYHSL